MASRLKANLEANPEVSPKMGGTGRRRVPLGRSRRRLSYSKRLRITLWLLSLPAFALTGLLLHLAHTSALFSLLALGVVLAGWAILQATIADRLLRPLQTLSNVVAALREHDYSFRARGGLRGDALGDLALEVNALANDLQTERLSSLDSAALVRRVLDVIQAPVLVLDSGGVLRFLNPAAAQLLPAQPLGTQLLPAQPLGRHASALGIAHLLAAADEQVVTMDPEARTAQWVLRRSRFREGGVPHDLLLLADVSQALREEQQEAWRRLIRVLGHEINNSLTPIKSLAGSLRLMLQTGADPVEFDRPLAVIEERADSLNRFLAAYRQLAQLAAPHRQRFPLASLLRQLASLETRLQVEVADGPELDLFADRDQLAQAVINLLRNGTEAALENPSRPPSVSMSWALEGSAAVIRIRDSGLGIANPGNLFVPFYTTKQHGTGIGLALVKQIAEAHNGSVSLYNHAGGGAEAALRLPDRDM